MKTIHHKIEQHTPLYPNTPKRRHASLRKTSPIYEKETAHALASPTIPNLEETKIALAQIKQIAKPPITVAQ